MRVRLLPAGTPHEVHPDVVYAGGGRIQPRWGFQWVGDVTAGDFRVKLIPAGTRHAYYANVEWNGSGDLRPTSGHTWASGVVGDYRVVSIVLTPPPNPLQRRIDERQREHRRRRAFESGVDAYARNDFARARDAFREALDLNPKNERYRAYLRKAERGLRSRQRQDMAEAYRRRVGTGVAAGIYVPSPRITALYYARIPPATDAWFKHTEPLVDLGNAALRKVQDGARWAKDVAWNEALLQADNKLKGLPGYELYRSFKTLEENQELLQEGYGGRVLRMAERHLEAVRGAVISAGRGTDDPLAAAEEDRQAFRRLAGEVAKRGAEGEWAPSGRPRRPTGKSQQPTIRPEARHAPGFEVNRWLEP